MNEIICGDALTVLKTLPSETAQTCITSPPYFLLRDYCCDGQIGLEATPERYAERLTAVFREVRRVLKPDGTLWVVISDTYAGRCFPNVKKKDMCGIPWLLAFALRDDGWWLRNDIIWAKNNCMPESVKDRLSSCYEHIFLFAKSHKYYFDYKSIMEPVAPGTIARMKRARSAKHKYAVGIPGQTVQGINMPRENRTGEDIELPTLRRKRDIWNVSTKNFSGNHAATFPVDLITPCIIAGCPPGGVVLDCFAGSGTTGVAALAEGRSFVGVELSPDYCALARERILNYSASKIGGQNEQQYKPR